MKKIARGVLFLVSSNPVRKGPVMINKTIEWVKGTEKAAERFYEKASEIFGDDCELAEFLSELAEDEKKHYKMVLAASGLAGNLEELPQGGSADLEVMSAIGSTLMDCEKRLEAGELTKTGLIDSIVTIEFSECNELFLYILAVMQAFPGEFRNAVTEIRKHKTRIMAFLDGKAEYAEYLERVRSLPDAAAERILVVDDEQGMLEVYEAFLSQVGNVESAVNGAEALGKIRENPAYSAIVTDVDMPVMDGFELHREVCSQFPSLKDRFVFLTGAVDPSKKSFFQTNGLKYLLKPVSITDIKTAVINIFGK